MVASSIDTESKEAKITHVGNFRGSSLTPNKEDLSSPIRMNKDGSEVSIGCAGPDVANGCHSLKVSVVTNNDRKLKGSKKAKGSKAASPKKAKASKKASLSKKSPTNVPTTSPIIV